ncbi:MAG: hypothetical protein FJW34_10055 [Acidobacteria bacterium]|nr:hypothetical protein [Acidobacteriota bacterium]
MIDISSISGGLSVAKSVYQALEFIRGIAGASVVAAYFRYDGTRVEGSDKVETEIHRAENNETEWWYSVKPLEDYVFVRVPVVESCAHELIGHVVGEPIPDAKYWRWVAPVLPGRLYGGEAVNLKVDFLVFGYKPKALIKHFASK